jgi:hypothetical protein
LANITDAEAFAALLDSLMRARDSCRTLGLLRTDERWIKVAGIFDQVKDNATRLMKNPRQAEMHGKLWLPPMR